MKGSFYANAFISFEPTGRGINKRDGSYAGDEYPQDGLPPFIIPDSPEVPIWQNEHPKGWTYNNPLSGIVQDDIAPKADLAASIGNVAGLKEIALNKPELLRMPDANGWQPIHEAAFAGMQKAIAFLVENGVDVNAETASGHTPLNLVLADKENMKYHPIVDFLKRHGGVARDMLPTIVV